MRSIKVTFKILRYKPGVIDPPRFQKYELQVEENMTVLEGLKKIRLEQDSSLMFRHSCLHSSCGTCACTINGEQKLACITDIMELNASQIELRPLDGFRQIGDLVVDMRGFFKDISSQWSYLRTVEITESVNVPEGIDWFVRLENCIECGACVAACPVSGDDKRFVGPAVLAAVHRDMLKSPGKNKELIDLAAGKNGVGLCERALDCSRVCPTEVYPARHIADLRHILNTE
jgi:succinate dehydrogenase / fumarate reductase iron-sulfur subunit